VKTKLRIRFHGRLRDFLPSEKKNRFFEHFVDGRPAVFDTIQALGVPHTEVARIQVGRRRVPFSYQVRRGDRISVWPGVKFKAYPKFILDVHLGKLARYLRLVGFDTEYHNRWSDKEIIQTAIRRGRVILTRDVGLLKHRRVKRGYWLRATDPKAQLGEILERFHLYGQAWPFTRCMECNGRLVTVRKKDVLRRLPPKTKEFFKKFYRCKHCRKVYWQGSHYVKLHAFVQKVIKP
jgi:uncharacterized protein with PIN domain